MKKLLSIITSLLVSITAFSPTFVGAEQMTTSSPVMTTIAVKLSDQRKADKANVESEIIAMQKDGVQAVRALMEKYIHTDTQEVGNLNFAVSMDTGEEKVNVLVTFDTYTYIINYLKNRQDFSVSGSVKIDATGTDKNLNATIKFAARFQTIDGNIFVTLSTLNVERTGDVEQIAILDSGLAEIQKYVGKTYKIPAKKLGLEDPSTISKQIEAVLQVIETQSLLEVQSKTKEVYTMRFKKSTLQNLNIAMGRKKNADLQSFSGNDGPITYSSIGDQKMLKLNNKKSPKKNYVLLTKSGTDYKLNTEIHEGSKLKGMDLSVDLGANSAKITSSDRNRYSTTQFNLNWMNGKLSSMVTEVPKNGTTTTFTTNGAFDLWAGDFDLTMTYNGTKVAGFMLNTTDGGYSYKFGVEYDQLAKFKIDSAGMATIQKGNFDIIAPTTFETLNQLDF